MNFTTTDAINWLHKTKEQLTTQMDYLTALDQTIGDGDHGMNMAKGFQAIVTQLKEVTEYRLQSVADVMQTSAHILMKTVGGASGLLYATAFLSMATVFRKAPEINGPIFTEALQKAVKEIEYRGNVTYGEKTLLDVWVEVTEQFEQSNDFPESSTIEKTAKQAMDRTKSVVAKKGKAALYEEASIGHIDPGAASTFYLFASLAEICKENENGSVC